MKKDLLLVTDMQNVYATGGEWHCPGAEEAAEKIRSLIERERERLDVIFTGFIADKDAEGIWKEYNREYAAINNDANANRMMEVFDEELGRYPLYTKSVYSSLKVPEIKEAVKNADRVLISGVVAECCVLSTVMDIIDAGIYVLYLDDCIAGLNDETETAVKTVLKGLEPLHVKVISSGDYGMEGF